MKLADTVSMEQVQEFNDLLFQLITERQQLFDSYLLPKLLEEYRVSHSAAKSIRTVLIKKGILHDDPYRYDSKIAEIEIPHEDPFTDAERPGVIGSRLSQYEAMIDYMANYYQFTCDFLTTDRISKLVALNRSFTWESFSNTSTRINTKGLADLVNNLRSSAEPLSLSIVNDSLSQLSKSALAITKILKNLTEFHRERYKVAVRKFVLPRVMIDPTTLSSGGMTAAIKEVKHIFAVEMKDQPFYPELIEEILKEDFSPEHAVLQQDLIARLSANKKESSNKIADENLKPMLMDGIRTLGSISPQLDVIAGKLSENERTLENIEKSFFEKFAVLLRKAFNIPEKHEDMYISTVDPVTQTNKREIINFLEFIEDIHRRSRLYTSFTLKVSPAYQKIESMEETQILDLLTRHIAEMYIQIKQCGGLDDYFKQNAPQEARDKIRGIKVEISAIKNSLVKANQCRAEYASQLEEQQQLKKLGITNV